MCQPRALRLQDHTYIKKLARISHIHTSAKFHDEIYGIIHVLLPRVGLVENFNIYPSTSSILQSQFWKVKLRFVSIFTHAQYPTSSRPVRGFAMHAVPVLARRIQRHSKHETTFF